MYKLAIADQSFRTVSWEKSLDLIKALDVDGLDLCVLDGRSALQFADLLGDPVGLAERVARETRTRDLPIASLDVTPGFTEIPGRVGQGYTEYAPNHPDATERERSWSLFRTAVAFSASLGIPTISIPCGVDFPDVETHEQSMSRAIEELGARHEYAARHEIVFAAEAHTGSVLEQPGDALTLCAAVPGISLTIDPSNFVYQGLTAEDIEPLFEYGAHFHARGAKEGLAQTRLRDSTFDHVWLREKLNELGYEGWIRMEYVWREEEYYLADVDVVTEIVELRDVLRGTV